MGEIVRQEFAIDGMSCQGCVRGATGATVPLATRACGLGVADQRLQEGRLHDFDPAGGGNALTETIIRVRRKGSAK